MSSVISISKETALSLYRRMQVIRQTEEQLARSHQRGLVHGACHTYVGEEAIASAVCEHLHPDDVVFSTHRGHGHAIAKGANPEAMMKELLGKVGGTSGGKGGSMHIADFSVGMLGANGVLADGLTMGVGAAQALVLRNVDAIVTVFVGDGTTNRGPFYESLNWAMIYELPILFVCENNTYASSTSTRKVTAGPGPVARAEAFGMPAYDVDGNDVREVDEIASKIITNIRNGGGPQFLQVRHARQATNLTCDTRWALSMTMRARTRGPARQWCRSGGTRRSRS